MRPARSQLPYLDSAVSQFSLRTRAGDSVWPSHSQQSALIEAGEFAAGQLTPEENPYAIDQMTSPAKEWTAVQQNEMSPETSRDKTITL
jgi:hypothetical protein